jgi:hypothetical protein
MISRRDHAQRPRRTRAKSAGRDRSEGTPAAGMCAHGASTAMHASGRGSDLPRRLALTHPPHNPYPIPTRKKHQQHRSEGAIEAGNQAGPLRSAYTWRNLVARARHDQVLHPATLVGRSVDLREQTNKLSHRRASGSKHRSRFTCQVATMHRRRRPQGWPARRTRGPGRGADGLLDDSAGLTRTGSKHSRPTPRRRRPRSMSAPVFEPPRLRLPTAASAPRFPLLAVSSPAYLKDARVSRRLPPCSDATKSQVFGNDRLTPPTMATEAMLCSEFWMWRFHDPSTPLLTHFLAI